MLSALGPAEQEPAVVEHICHLAEPSLQTLAPCLPNPECDAIHTGRSLEPPSWPVYLTDELLGSEGRPYLKIRWKVIRRQFSG